METFVGGQRMRQPSLSSESHQGGLETQSSSQGQLLGRVAGHRRNQTVLSQSFYSNLNLRIMDPRILLWTPGIAY